MKAVCLVMGAGAGIGGNVGKRFAQAGYHAVLCRRTDQDGLDALVADIEGAGGSASGHLLNAVDADGIEERVAAVEAEIGPIEVVVFNLGAQIGKQLGRIRSRQVLGQIKDADAVETAGGHLSIWMAADRPPYSTSAGVLPVSPLPRLRFGFEGLGRLSVKIGRASCREGV